MQRKVQFVFSASRRKLILTGIQHCASTQLVQINRFIVNKLH